jgi:hypothetical protein
LSQTSFFFEILTQIAERFELLIFNGSQDLYKFISSLLMINVVQYIVVQEYHGLANPLCLILGEREHQKSKIFFGNARNNNSI